METFTTGFLMSGVRTNVTIQLLGEDKFGFALHFSDALEGDELVPPEGVRDGVVIQDENGRWQLEGNSKVDLSEDDVQNLGSAIDDLNLR